MPVRIDCDLDDDSNNVMMFFSFWGVRGKSIFSRKRVFIPFFVKGLVERW